MVEVVNLDAAKLEDHVAVMQSALRSGRLGIHLADPGTLRPVEPQSRRVFLAELGLQIDPQRPPGHVTVGDQLVHDPPGQVDRDAETDALVAPAVGGDRVVDPDHLALHIDQRSARIARVDRRVGLQESPGSRRPGARPCAGSGR